MSSRNLGLRGHGIFLWALIAVFVGVTSGADTKSAGKSSGKEAATKDNPAVRLPPHFADVVKEDQRAKIVAIRESFAPRIQKKRNELQALIDERDEAVWKVLTPAQRKEIESRRAESQASRNSGDDEGDLESDAKVASPSVKKAGKSAK